MGTWIFVAIAYLSLPIVILTLVGATRRVRRETARERCPACRYSLEGLGPSADCPECGTKRVEMVWVKRSWATFAQRWAVAFLAPSIAAVVGTSVVLAMRPAEEVAVTVAFVLAPYAVVVLTLLIFHRPARAMASVLLASTLGVVCSLILAFVMVSYWSAPIEGEDFGWPITDIALLSLAYSALFIIVCTGWVVGGIVARKTRA